MAGSASIGWLHDGNEPVILDYTEITSPVTPTATSEATADTVVSASAVNFDGGTRVKISFYCEAVMLFPSIPNPNPVCILTLYDGSSSIGYIAWISSGFPTGSNNAYRPVTVSRVLTPSNASHTYSIRAYVGSGDSVLVEAGIGGASHAMPAYIMIETAP